MVGYIFASAGNLNEALVSKYADTHIANALSYYSIAIIFALIIKALKGNNVYPEESGASIAQKGTNKYMNTLTDREKETLHLLCLGKSNREIAESLFISENAVRNHASNIYKKLGVKSRGKLIGVKVEI